MSKIVFALSSSQSDIRKRRVLRMYDFASHLKKSRAKYLREKISVIKCFLFVEEKKSKFLFLSLKFCDGRKSVGLTSHRGLSTLTKYHCEAVGLHEFLHNSGICSFMHYFSYKIGLCFALFM